MQDMKHDRATLFDNAFRALNKKKTNNARRGCPLSKVKYRSPPSHPGRYCLKIGTLRKANIRSAILARLRLGLETTQRPNNE